MIVTLTPTPSIDRTVRLDRLVLGAVNRTGRAYVEASGKGVNVTRVLAARGYASTAVVPAGGAEGAQLLALLAEAGVRTRSVATERPVRVNLSVVLPGGQTTKLNEPGAVLSPGEQSALLAAVAEACREATWLVISGSLPEGADDLVKRAVEAGHGAGVRVAVDTSGPPLLAAAEAGADLIAPNTEELAAVTGRPVGSVQAVAAAARDLVPKALSLVSMGADGALLVAEESWWHAVPPEIDVVNTVGAGDALLAGFLAEEDDRRLARAVAWGTSACLVAGTAELPERPVGPEAVNVTSDVTGRGRL